MIRKFSFICAFICCFIYNSTISAKEQPSIETQSPSVLLMELETGEVLFEKDSDTPRKPASVTKLMTMLLAFEAIDSGRLSLEDSIVVSEHAASMGGSQVYLEVGETQTVKDILKCMIISSANDAAVAMGEAIAGTEKNFVKMMNKKAKDLGMKHTHFKNACGLEAQNHHMSAKDVAILSRELLIKHPSVTEYTTIWMDQIIHKTRKGESEFGLANTNKFLKKYQGANGLKTGYTSAAGFSMSATATRNNTTLIAVVMGSKTKDIRYRDAATLLDFGFANCKIYEDCNVLDGKKYCSILNGTKKILKIKSENNFRHVIIGHQNEKISKEFHYIKRKAPIKKGESIAKVEYKKDKNKIGEVLILADESMDQANYFHTLINLFYQYIDTYS